MDFNIQKFLTENKLTRRSLAEADDILEPETGVEDEPEIDLDGDEDSDSWNKPEDDDSGEFEKEPTAADIKEPGTGDIHKKQSDLKALTDKKDKLLMMYKSGQIGLDQYKELIGNIPQLIKKLRDQIGKAMAVSIDDEDEE
jgi:hypothetical protein